MQAAKNSVRAIDVGSASSRVSRPISAGSDVSWLLPT